MPTREEILNTALLSREEEVLMYQINIDNYTTALASISQKTPEEQADLASFKNQLEDLLASERREQQKSKILLDAIKTQLEL